MKNQMRKGSASDYITAKKRNAIYVGIKTDAQLTGNTTNPLKKNGFYYNNMLNVCVPQNCTPADCAGGVLTNAKSYELRLDFKQGKYYNNYICKCGNNIIKEVDLECNVTPIPGKLVIDCLCSVCAFNNSA